MWMDLVRGNLVEESIMEGKVGEACNIMIPQIKPLLSGSVIEADILNEMMKNIWFSSKGVAKNPQAQRSIGGRSWRALIWSVLSVLATGYGELPVLQRMSNRVLPDWVRDKARVTFPSNPDIFIDPDFLLLRLDIHGAINGVSTPEKMRELLDENPEVVKQIDILWCKTQFSDTIKEYALVPIRPDG